MVRNRTRALEHHSRWSSLSAIQPYENNLFLLSSKESLLEVTTFFIYPEGIEQTNCLLLLEIYY